MVKATLEKGAVLEKNKKAVLWKKIGLALMIIPFICMIGFIVSTLKGEIANLLWPLIGGITAGITFFTGWYLYFLKK